MNAPKTILNGKVFRHVVLLAAGLALSGFAAPLACRAGQSRAGAQVFFVLEQSSDHVARGAVLSPDGTTLVYVGEDERLHTCNVGTGEKNLLLGKRNERNLEFVGDPAFSPDGAQVVFVGSVGFTAYYPFDIYSVHLDGSNLRQITHAVRPTPAEKAEEERDVWYQQFLGPHFSPDGTKILLGLFDPSRPNEQVALISADGSGLKLLGQGKPLFWSADSQSVYYQPKTPGVFLEKLDLATGASEGIHGLPQGLIDTDGVIPNILGKLPDKDWFLVAAPRTPSVSMVSVQHGAATSQASLGIPLSESTPKGPLFLVSVQWTPSGRVLLVYRGDENGWMISEPTVNVERFEVAQATY